MPTTYPALRGNFGNTEYWLTTMQVGELIRTVRSPKDVPGWENLSVEEKYQRDLNFNRVRKEIAPYFAGDEERFSGALVLAMMHHDDIEFEPLQTRGGGSNCSQPLPRCCPEYGVSYAQRE